MKRKSRNLLNTKIINKDFLKYIGPGILVTVGFIDPGNWVSNIAAGSDYGYKLLWIVTLSTIMLIILQHNAAHLGIVTGLCISEAINTHMNKILGRIIIVSAVFASISTATAEILGAAIALKLLFNIPITIGAFISSFLIMFMLLSNSYKKIEKIIIGFVSIIGISFIFETFLVDINWGEAIKNSLIPNIPSNSLPIVMSVLGAVVMPHNLFLHSEVIQSRKWNLKNKAILEHQLKFEFLDTILSMGIGFIINSSMILIATSFFKNGIVVTELEQAQSMLKPIAGNIASLLFAIALLFAGLASSVTAGMAGGSIFAGMFGEEYDINNKHSKMGITITIIFALIIIFFIGNPFKALLYSQMLLSIQLPITIFSQIYLTSSEKVMGKYKNTIFENIILWSVGLIVSILNIMLLVNSLLIY